MSRWERRRNPTWQIVLGVALGIVILGVVGFYARLWIVQRTFENMADQATQMQIKAQQAAQQAMSRVKADQAERERQVRERADGERAAAAQRREDEARRERAWAKYYTKPSRCDNAPSDETLVQCANEYIRAKRAFEAEYAAGKI